MDQLDHWNSFRSDGQYIITIDLKECTWTCNLWNVDRDYHPPARQDKHITIVIILSMIVSLLFKYIKALSFISSGFVIIICTLIAATFGAILFPVEEEETHES